MFIKKRDKSFLVPTLVAGLLLAGAVYIFTSSSFEQDEPLISLDSTSDYWNLKKPIKLSLSDDSGIKSYKVTMLSQGESSVLYHEQLLEPKKSIELSVEPTRAISSMKIDEIKLVVEANDASKWNLFAGNSVTKEYSFKIDKNKPHLNILSNSYKITKGGSALVVFQAKDENLDKLYIDTNFGKKFLAQPFMKDGYYIALIAWPLREESFSATLYADDKAGNVSKVHIPLFLQNHKFRVSNITLSDAFLKGKIAELAEEFEETQGVSDDIERFKIINETIRAKNEKLIYDITSKVPQDLVEDFKINKMYPLKNAAAVASHGDHRIFSYGGKVVSDSYHMGLDLASNAMAEIKPQNGGEVVYTGYNGLYGNMPIIYHGLGLYTLYGHCSSINVNTGDMVPPLFPIANSGKSGFAMGDHLHFGIVVQGVEVRPDEWMDANWIKLNITDIITNAKAVVK